MERQKNFKIRLSYVWDKKGEFFSVGFVQLLTVFRNKLDKDLVLGIVNQPFIFVSNAIVSRFAYYSRAQLATETGEYTVRRLCYKYATDQ